MAQSQDKHHCTYCNIWVQGDRVSIRNHEATQRHKDRTQAQFKIRTRDREIAERQEANMQRELDQVERNARARFARDMAGKTRTQADTPIDLPAVGPLPRQVAQLAAPSAMPPPPPPRMMAPPPPPRNVPMRLATPVHAHPPVQQPYLAVPQHVVAPPPRVPAPRVPPPQIPPPQAAPPVVAPPPAPAPEQSPGFYVVRGTVYLEGQFHEFKLVPKKVCEVWVEDLEDWRPASISSVENDTSTKPPTKRYVVAYKATDDRTAPAVSGVFTSDQLRLCLTLPTEVATAEQITENGGNGFLDALYQGRSTQYLAARAPGYGEWSTVSVRIVDDAAEEKARAAEVAAFEASKKAIQLERDNEMIMEESLHADNALGAFNPWGGSYKGIALDDDVRPPVSDDETAPAAPVAFKKRARKEKGGRNTRPKRNSADEDA